MMAHWRANVTSHKQASGSMPLAPICYIHHPWSHPDIHGFSHPPTERPRRALSLCHLPVGFDTKKGFFQVFTGPSLDFLIFVFAPPRPPHRVQRGRSDGHAPGAGAGFRMTHAQVALRVDCFQRCQVSAQHHCVIDGFQKSVFCCRCRSVQSRCAQIAGIKEGDLDRFG